MRFDTTEEEIIITYEHYDIFKFNMLNSSFINDLKNYKLKNDKNTLLNAGLVELRIPISEIDITTDTISLNDVETSVFTAPIPFNKGTLVFLSKTNELTQVKLDATPTSQLGVKTALQNLTGVEQINNLITSSNRLYNQCLNEFWLILLGIMETTRLQLSSKIYEYVETLDVEEEEEQQQEQTVTNTNTSTDNQTPQQP